MWTVLLNFKRVSVMQCCIHYSLPLLPYNTMIGDGQVYVCTNVGNSLFFLFVHSFIQSVIYSESQLTKKTLQPIA